MYTNPYKGGLGKKAPYKSTHIRVPEDIKEPLQGFADVYRIFCGLNDRAGLDFLKTALKNYLDCFLILDEKLCVNCKLVNEETELWIQKEFIRHQREIVELRQVIADMEDTRRETKVILQDALLLKPNAGGAIKKEIRKAIDALS